MVALVVGHNHEEGVSWLLDEPRAASAMMAGSVWVLTQDVLIYLIPGNASRGLGMKGEG